MALVHCTYAPTGLLFLSYFKLDVIFSDILNLNRGMGKRL